MKTKNLELDVDFIGGQTPLTKDEEKALSNYFSERKRQLIPTKLKQKSSATKIEKSFV